MQSNESNGDSLAAENAALKEQLATLTRNAGLHIPYEDLDVQDEIGGGGYSIVHRGLWLGAPVAIKKWFDPSQSERMMTEFREEVMTMQYLRHPNVVQFLGACMLPPHLVMVTEHLPHSLHTVIYNAAIDLDRKRVVALAQDICRALMYLHSRKPTIVHRDIKPANFLVDRAWRVKVCDFGLASNSRQQAGAGTPAYMAPELLQGKPYNEKADIYALGVVLNEMGARRQPFDGLPPGEIRAAVLAGQRPEVPLTCPKPLSELIRQCWHDDQTQRPSAAKVLETLKDLASKV